MNIHSVGLKAYTDALKSFNKANNQAKEKIGTPAVEPQKPFADVLETSLSKVNELQQKRTAMITSFASGETQNVHELMIALQKAGLAMNMTSAVRNKVMEAYKELSRMQF